MTQTEVGTRPTVLGLKVGDLVEVRSADEILATLDERGELENLPFMPEMLAFCGQRLTVQKVAHKLCDTISRSGMRRMTNAVHLTGSRCDGSAHGGCQTACSLYWKEQWLRRVDPGSPPPAPSGSPEVRYNLPILEINSRKEPGPDGEVRYSCQATELLRAAPTCLPFRDLGQYVQDVSSGNVGVLAVLRAFGIGLFNRMQNVSKKVLPRRLWFRDGLRWRFLKGGVLGRTPTGKLDLQPGELVRIKSKDDILATARRKPAQPRHGFRRRNVALLRADCRCSGQGRALHRREDGPNADHEEPVHRSGERLVRGGLQRQLPDGSSCRFGGKSGSKE